MVPWTDSTSLYNGPRYETSFYGYGYSQHVTNIPMHFARSWPTYREDFRDALHLERMRRLDDALGLFREAISTAAAVSHGKPPVVVDLCIETVYTQPLIRQLCDVKHFARPRWSGKERRPWRSRPGKSRGVLL